MSTEAETPSTEPATETTKSEAPKEEAKTEVTNGSEPTKTEEASPELEAKIIKQVEYYFGDANLGRDRFLREQIKKDEGWVSLEVLITFNRLKSLSTDFAVICNALRKSTAELLEVDDENTKVRRSPSKPVPPNTAERRDEVNSRSVYAKGFPLDATLDPVQEFMEKHGEIETMSLRKDQHKKFKGSIFVTFKTKESADAFLKEESVKYGDTELKRLLKDTYFKQKIEQRNENKERNQKEKQEKKVKREEEELAEFKEKMTEGALLQLTDLADDLSREDIKETFQEHADIAWVDFERGEKEACVRFAEAGQAAMAWEKAKEAGEGKVVIKEKEVTGRVLEGDEEVVHWREAMKQQAEKRKRNRKGFRGRGGYQNKRGRSHDGGPPRKHAKRD